MKNLPEKIRELRKRKRMTQTQVASAAGISRQTYCSFETGQSDLKSENLMKIFEVLGVDLLSK